MKKALLIIISIGLFFASCSDSWLETTNQNQLDFSSFYSSENDLIAAVNAAYTPLSHTGMYGLQYIRIFNTLDPYIWNEDYSGVYEQFTFQSSTSNFLGMWQELYRGLFRTSDVLANMYRVEELVDSTDYISYQAQLKGLRGMYYFYLVTHFNRPIYYDETNVPTDPGILFTNTEPVVFWNKLEEDLRFAAFNLRSTWGTDDKGRITSAGANAQLGKALLYKHYHYYLRFGITEGREANLDSAKVAFQRVIENDDYGLMLPLTQDSANYQAAMLSNSSYVDIPVGGNTYDSENNKESLWEVQYNDDPGSNTSLPGYLTGGQNFYIYFSPHASGYKNFAVEPSFWFECEDIDSSAPAFAAGYSKKDPRFYASCYLLGDTMDWRPESGYNTPYTAGVNIKSFMLNSTQSGYSFYNFPEGTSTQTQEMLRYIGVKKMYYPQHYTQSAPGAAPHNVRVIRYADVLLMFAEVCYQQGNTDPAGLDALNEVRARAGMNPIDELTGEAIIHERNVELFGEALRFNDIVRWSFDGTNISVDLDELFGGKFVTPKHLYLPIPLDEISTNKGSLVQNPGY